MRRSARARRSRRMRRPASSRSSARSRRPCQAGNDRRRNRSKRRTEMRADCGSRADWTRGVKDMCGIVGAIAERNIVPVLVEGLKRLEYRGYDSAGVAVLQQNHKLGLRRTVGKVAQLEEKLAASPLSGKLGVAHTRWATHGGVTEANAHPHLSGDRVAVIHNGIIENYEPIKAELIAKGYEFKSETDTEVAAHL